MHTLIHYRHHKQFYEIDFTLVEMPQIYPSEAPVAENTGRMPHDFPLSNPSLHDAQNNVANASTGASRLAQGVQTLARELSMTTCKTPNS